MTDFYPLVPIGDHVQLTQGYKFLREHFADEGIPLIKIGNITHGRLDLSNVSFIDEGCRDSLSNHFAVPGEILIAITGSGPSNPASAVGKLARYNGDPDTYFVNQRVARIKSFDEIQIDLRYLYFLMLRPHFVDNLRRGAGGTGQASIRFEQILNYKIPLPPIEEQQLFGAALDRITDRIDLCFDMAETLKGIIERLTEDGLSKGINALNISKQDELEEAEILP